VAEAAVVPEDAASAEGEEAAGHALPFDLEQARLRVLLVPSRRPPYAVRVYAHVLPGHERLVQFLAPDGRRQWGGRAPRPVNDGRADVRDDLPVEPGHGVRGLLYRLHVNEHESL